MGVVNILALNEKEIETVKLLLEYGLKKGRDEKIKVICTELLEKINLKYYFSPEEDGKLQGLSQKAKLLYYEFYEKYDFDLIDYIGRAAEENKAPNDVYKVIVDQFPIAKLLFKRYPDEIQMIILKVLNDK